MTLTLGVAFAVLSGSRVGCHANECATPNVRALPYKRAALHRNAAGTSWN